MKKIHFITDLDRTIIHAKNKGYRCVEHMGEKEVTYMTEKSYTDFLEILNNDNLEFIPCTMRNLKQTLRVDFIKEYNPRVIICTNGAQIYISGELDLEWDNYIKSTVNKSVVVDDINYIKTLNLKYDDIRNIEGFYITIKCATKEEAQVVFSVLKNKFKTNIKVMHIGVKIFIIDERINKIYAVDYIIKKYDIDNLFTAGDSEVDLEFTTRGKAIIPKHACFRHVDAFVTEKEGIHSTEDLIDYLKKEFNK
ncbi:HAD family hydrolase [uncultured Clostridium sp.]|jgi:hydroxymethylpyrimidine pyrophosphatase-like HAD family hydrolase|uniref:HAD family hydrolase n=1 Tax=uncultured Clostridium sp. TaxID=59620 RepID=UPI0026121E5A|nr:HAD family hydrolase [uncultured Clostridium sp.]